MQVTGNPVANQSNQQQDSFIKSSAKSSSANKSCSVPILNQATNLATEREAGTGGENILNNLGSVSTVFEFSLPSCHIVDNHQSEHCS